MINQKLLILLVGASEEPPTSYEIIRLLTRRFKIDNYLKIINECIDENYVERINQPSSEMGSYRLTVKGIEKFNKIDKINFKLELLELFPDERNFIELLLRN